MMSLLRRLRYAIACMLIVAIIGTIGGSFAADNIVAPSLASDMLVDAAPPQVTPTSTPTPISTPTPLPNIPAACAALNLTNVVVITGNGAIFGTSSNDLIVGSVGKDTIHAGAGNDCLVGGGGADQFFGDAGFDVCIGSGDSKEQFHDCEVIIP